MKFFFSVFFILVCCGFGYYAEGQVMFQKAYGGNGNDHAYSVELTNDGGYIIVGTTTSFGAGSFDVYLIKANLNDSVQWTKTFGGVHDDLGYAVSQTSDGGYIITGYSDINGTGYYDAFLLKTDSSGNEMWSKSYGSSYYDVGYSVAQTSDNGFLFVGSTGPNNMLVIKTDALGDTIWTRTFDSGNGNASGYSVKQTMDGGYIITGYMDVIYSAICLIKIDDNGNIVWVNTYSGSMGESGRDVIQASDSGYIVTGTTHSFGVDQWGDICLIKTDINGMLTWAKTYGTSYQETGYSIQQTSDGGYIVVGSRGNFPQNIANVHLIKTDNLGDTLWTKLFGRMHDDKCYSVKQALDGSYILAGYSMSIGSDFYLIKTDSNGNSNCNVKDSEVIVTSPIFQVSAPVIFIGSGLNVTSLTFISGTGGTLVDLCSVGIQELIIAKTFSLSPNPATTHFTFTTDQTITDGIIEILNSLGQKVFEQVLPGFENLVSLPSDISPGIYFVKLTADEKFYSQKLIVASRN